MSTTDPTEQTRLLQRIGTKGPPPPPRPLEGARRTLKDPEGVQLIQPTPHAGEAERSRDVLPSTANSMAQLLKQQYLVFAEMETNGTLVPWQTEFLKDFRQKLSDADSLDKEEDLNKHCEGYLDRTERYYLTLRLMEHCLLTVATATGYIARVYEQPAGLMFSPSTQTTDESAPGALTRGEVTEFSINNVHPSLLRPR